jgi:hypothetical protein
MLSCKHCALLAIFFTWKLCKQLFEHIYNFELQQQYCVLEVYVFVTDKALV